MQIEKLQSCHVPGDVVSLPRYFRLASKPERMKNFLERALRERVPFVHEVDAWWSLLCMLFDAAYTQIQPGLYDAYRAQTRMTDSMVEKRNLHAKYWNELSKRSEYRALTELRDTYKEYGKQIVEKNWRYIPEFRQSDVAMFGLRTAMKLFPYVFDEALAREAFSGYDPERGASIYYEKKLMVLSEQLHEMGGEMYFPYVCALLLLVSSHRKVRVCFERATDTVMCSTHLIEVFGGKEAFIIALIRQTEPYVYFAKEMGRSIYAKERSLFGEDKLPRKLWRMFVFMKRRSGTKRESRTRLLQLLVAKRFEDARLLIEEIEAEYPGTWQAQYLVDLRLEPRVLRQILAEDAEERTRVQVENRAVLKKARAIFDGEARAEEVWNSRKEPDVRHKPSYPDAFSLDLLRNGTYTGGYVRSRKDERLELYLGHMTRVTYRLEPVHTHGSRMSQQYAINWLHAEVGSGSKLLEGGRVAELFDTWELYPANLNDPLVAFWFWQEQVRQITPYFEKVLVSSRDPALRFWVRPTGPYNRSSFCRRHCVFVVSRAFPWHKGEWSKKLDIWQSRALIDAHGRVMEMIRGLDKKRMMRIDTALYLIRRWDCEIET